MSEELIFENALVRVDSVTAQGRKVQINATGEELLALAELTGVTSVTRFEVDIEILKFRGGIEVTGILRARIVQPCVVTLEPVAQEIEEPVLRVYLPSKPQRSAAQGPMEVVVDPDEDDVPDAFEGRQVDLSHLLVEIFSLAIDPYPRAPGAELPEVADEEEAESGSPFAQLRDLNPKGD